MANKKFSDTSVETLTAGIKILAEDATTVDKFAHITGQKISDFIDNEGFLKQAGVEALTSLLKRGEFVATDNVLKRDITGSIVSVPISDMETAYPQLIWSGFDISATSTLSISEGRFYNETLFSTAFTKTWATFAQGSSNGCLDTASLATHQRYNVLLINDGTDYDIYVTVGLTAPSGWTKIKQLGIFWTGNGNPEKIVQLKELYNNENAGGVILPPNFKNDYDIEVFAPDTIKITNCFVIDSTNKYNMYLFGTKYRSATLTANTDYDIYLTSDKGNNLDIEIVKTASPTTTNPHFRKIGYFKTDASGQILTINLINLSNNFKEIVVGDFDNGNYTHIYPDGTLRYRGDATVWNDISASLIARRLESTTGKLQYNYNNNSIIMEPGGSIGNTADRFIVNYEKLHGIKKDSHLKLHLHFEQVSSDKLEFAIQYRLQKNGEAKVTTWTSLTANTDDDCIFPYVSGTLNNIIELADVSWGSSMASSFLQFRIARTDSTADDIEAVWIDAHVEFDADGSE